MRPAIARLFDHQIRIWRATPETQNLGIQQRRFVPISIVGAVVNRSRTITALVTGGQSSVGSFRWYGKPDINIRRRDLCEVIEGSESGHTWEVDAEPTRLKRHHTEVNCVEWHGILPSLEEPS